MAALPIKLWRVYLFTWPVAAALIALSHAVHRSPPAERAAMWRTFSGYLVITSIVFATATSRTTFAVLLVVVVATSLREYLGVAGGSVTPGTVCGVGIAVSPLLTGGAGAHLALAAAVLYLLVAPLAAADLGAALRSSATTIVGLLFIAFFGATTLLFGGRDDFPQRFAYFYLLVAINDAGGLVWGRLLRGRQLCPLISPRKTLAGAIGALLSTLAVTVAGASTGAGVGTLVLTGTAISVAGQCGDLVASSVKRVAKVKDFGARLPIFGGVLDRFDAFFFAAPVYYALVTIGAV